MKRLVLLIIALAFMGCNAWGATYYISQSGEGDGSAVGTPDSIADFNAAGAPFDDLDGDTVYFLGTITTTITPTTGGSSTTSKLTLRGDYTGQESTVSVEAGVGTIGIYINDIDYVDIIGFTIQTCESLVRGIECTYVTGRNITFQNGSQRGWYFSSTDDSDYVEYIYLYNSTFTNIGTWGDSAAADINYVGYTRRTLTQDCTFQGDGSANGVDGITFTQDAVGGGLQNVGSYHRVINCDFLGGHEENGLDMKAVQQSAANEGWSYVTNCTFIAYNNSNNATVLHKGTKQVEFSGCKWFSNYQAVLIYPRDEANAFDGDEGYYNFLNCIFSTSNASHIANTNAACAGNINILNCTFSKSGQTDTGASACAVVAVVESPSWTLKNNVFYSNNEARYGDNGQVYQIYFTDTDGGHTIDYNDYWSPAGVLGGDVVRWGANLYTLAEMITNTTNCDNDIEANPLFVSSGGASAQDFQLRHTSPCINAGTTIAGVATDYFGRTRLIGSAVDIGAIESRYHRRRWRWR